MGDAHRCPSSTLPICITCSPDESHNVLMLRFVRARHLIPAYISRNGDKCSDFRARREPDIAEGCTATFDTSFEVKELAGYIPDLESRKRFKIHWLLWKDFVPSRHSRRQARRIALSAVL